MILEDNYSSSPPVVLKNSTMANATSIQALSVWEGARAVEEYKSRLTVKKASNTQDFYGKWPQIAKKNAHIFTQTLDLHIL